MKRSNIFVKRKHQFTTKDNEKNNINRSLVSSRVFFVPFPRVLVLFVSFPYFKISITTCCFNILLSSCCFYLLLLPLFHCLFSQGSFRTSLSTFSKVGVRSTYTNLPRSHLLEHTRFVVVVYINKISARTFTAS